MTKRVSRSWRRKPRRSFMAHSMHCFVTDIWVSVVLGMVVNRSSNCLTVGKILVTVYHYSYVDTHLASQPLPLRKMKEPREFGE